MYYIKKTLLPMLVLLMAMTQTAWAQSTFTGGRGTQTDPYLISSVDDWNVLANSVNDGTSTYSGVYFKLTTDIDDPVTTMVGTVGADPVSARPFQGFFIGNGKKLNVNYDSSEQYAAPFRYIDGATITGLTIKGTIHTSAKFGGGLVGQAIGSNVIAGCRISVALYSEVSGEGAHGGLVGNIDGGNTLVDNCLVDGKMLGDQTTDCGGFVGWCNTSGGASLTLSNCMFNPSQVTISYKGSSPLARYAENVPVDLDNCYFTSHVLGVSQGYLVVGYNASRLVTALGSGWEEKSGKCVPITDSSNIGSAIVKGLNKRYQHQGGSAIAINYTVTAADGSTDYEVFLPQRPSGICVVQVNSNEKGVTGSELLQF